MKHKKLFRHHHSFYTQKNNSLFENNNQEQNSLEKGIIHTRPPLNDAPDNYLTKLKPKTGLERFTQRYPNYEEMFIGSRK